MWQSTLGTLEDFDPTFHHLKSNMLNAQKF